MLTAFRTLRNATTKPLQGAAKRRRAAGRQDQV